MTDLIYQIALEYIVVKTETPEGARAQTLAKYEPFSRQALPAEMRPLLTIWDNASVVLESEDKLIEEVKEIGFTITVFRRPKTGEWLIRNVSKQGSVLGLISPDWSELRLSHSLAERRLSYMLDRLIMIAYSVASFPKGLLKVHASVITLRGQALVLMGVSGTGKSTHSRLWLQHIEGAELLNDDEPIIRIVEDKVRVFGCPWSGSTPCYKDMSAEVAAFVHLYQAPENRLSKLSPREAFNSLFTSCSFFMPIPEIQQTLFNTVADVLNKVSVYRLDNRPEYEAVALSHSLLPSTQF